MKKIILQISPYPPRGLFPRGWGVSGGGAGGVPRNRAGRLEITATGSKLLANDRRRNRHPAGKAPDWKCRFRDKATQ